MYVTLIGCNLKNVCINDVCRATEKMIYLIYVPDYDSRGSSVA